MSEPAIRCQGLNKKFAISLKRAMWYGLVDIGRAALLPQGRRSLGLDARVADFNRENGVVKHEGSHPAGADGLRPSEFWALRDVSFELRQGECLGVVGHNGAGKSTLFSVLSGIYGPTSGRIEVRGRLQALIALGAGFHPVLSGRENIYIYASVLGLKTREVDAIYDEIVDFAELGDFIDMPVKKYSSGMMVRLGFSVAVHLKPDILLVDEVLSVGDVAFRNKSFQKMRTLMSTGIPVMFVSHFAPAVEKVCSRVMWLDHGKVRGIGDTAPMLKAYAEVMDSAVNEEKGAASRDALHPIRIEQVDVLGGDGKPAEQVGFREPLSIRMRYEARQPVPAPYFSIQLKKAGRDDAFTRFSMCDDDIALNLPAGRGDVVCRMENLPLSPGVYEVRCGIQRGATVTTGDFPYQDTFLAARFRVAATSAEMSRPGALESLHRDMPPLLLPHTWEHGHDHWTIH